MLNETMNVGMSVGSRKVVREGEYQKQFRIRGEQETNKQTKKNKGRRVSSMINSFESSS